MDEYIKREDAINEFYIATADGDKANWCVSIIQSIPAVNVKPVIRGEWERVGNTDHFKCTCCNNMILATWDMPSVLLNFCPNCGADMRGE